MAENRYAPPRSDVADVVHDGRAAPPLWNPNAAASWSLLFSPAFGALLQMSNWRALGEPAKARASKIWAIASGVVFVLILLVSLALPDTKAVDGATRAVGLALLLSWYFSLGRTQAAYVQARYGKDYPRRGWARPLLLAVLAVIGYVALAVLLALVFLPADAPA